MLTLSISDVDKTDLRKELLIHGLIHIKCDSPISIDVFKDTIKRLGQLLVARKAWIDSEQNVQYISDKGLFGNENLEWHNDWSSGAGNFHGTALYNNKNGHLSTTDFIDMREAYENYPDKDYLHNTQGVYAGAFGWDSPQAVKRNLAHTHHVTGDTVLYISPRNMDPRIDITDLIEYCEQQDIYEHHWQDNDILIIDNLRVMHRRHAFEGERELWKILFLI